MSMRCWSRWFRHGLGLWLGLVLCAAAAAAPPRAAAAPPRAAAAPPPAAGRQHRVSTDHYNVITDVSEGFTHLVAQHMEAIYKEYRRKLQGYDLKVHGRFEVRVFARRADYDAAVPAKLKGSRGAFISRSRCLWSFKEGRTDEATFRTLYHEGFHQFMYSCMTLGSPVWVNEGLAEYFGESTWNGRGFSTGQVPGARLRRVQDAIEDRSHIPLRTLFAMENDRWLGNLREDPDRASLQYSEAWSVVHFLLHARGGKYRARLLGYLRNISAGMEQERAFRESFGTKVEPFQRAWAQYVLDLVPSPDDVCRGNMELVAFLALQTYGKPQRFTSIRKLRDNLLGGRGSWTLTSADGETLSSRDARGVKGLFKCPHDRSDAPISYVLLRNRRAELPELYCTHHSGVVFRAHYVREEDGGYRAVVEQQVKATVPRGVTNALKSQGR